MWAGCGSSGVEFLLTIDSFLFRQHCKPAVDEDTFQKMVDRQYEMIRRPRSMDDASGAKNIARSEDSDVHGSAEHPAPSTLSEAVMGSDSEVHLF